MFRIASCEYAEDKWAVDESAQFELTQINDDTHEQQSDQSDD